jgi:hypothetical protein
MNNMAQNVVSDVPTFTRLIDLVSTSRATGLSDLQKSWNVLSGCPIPSKIHQIGAPAPSPSPSPSPLQTGGGGTMVVNAYVDTKAWKHYTDHGATSIKAMIGTRTMQLTQVDGKEMCLAWALKGSYFTGCNKHKDQHVRATAATTKFVHKFLDMYECSLANPQP